MELELLIKGFIGLFINSDVVSDLLPAELNSSVLTLHNRKTEPKLGLETAARLKVFVDDGTVDGRQKKDFLEYVSTYTVILLLTIK